MATYHVSHVSRRLRDIGTIVFRGIVIARHGMSVSVRTHTLIELL